MKIEQATGKNANVTITTRDDEKKGIIKLDGGILVWKGSGTATPAEASVIHNERNLMTGKTIVENTETDQDTLDWATLKKLAEIIAEEETIDNDTKEVEVTYGGKNYKLGIGDIAIVYFGKKEPREAKRVRVLGFNHDIVNRETGISFEFVDKLGISRANASSTNVGGWGTSEIRTRLNQTEEQNGTYLPNIKDAATGGNGIAQYIKGVNKPYNSGSTEYTNNISDGDKLWFLSCAEIWPSSSRYSAQYNNTAEGVCYAYYNYSGEPHLKGNFWWWLRSPYTGNGFAFCTVSSGNENCGSAYAIVTGSVAPCFTL